MTGLSWVPYLKDVHVMKNSETALLTAVAGIPTSAVKLTVCLG